MISQLDLASIFFLSSIKNWIGSHLEIEIASFFNRLDIVDIWETQFCSEVLMLFEIIFH